MKKYKIFIERASAKTSSIFFIFVGVLCSSQNAFAQFTLPTPAETGLSDQSPQFIIQAMVTWALGIVGALSILFLVIGGIFYMTSTGDETKIDTARRIITFSIIGLIVALLGWVIVNTIITNL